MLDTSGIVVGARVRCGCGATSTVHEPAPIAVRALTCSHCGGAFQNAAITCPWCDAGITLEDRHLSGVCGHCCARLTTDARYCPGCGIELVAQTVSALRTDSSCPRCRSAMRVRRLEEREFIECSNCGGLWLSPAALETLCARAEEAGAMQRSLESSPAPLGLVAEARVAYLPCVTCHQLMIRRNFGHSSGIIVDVCRDHGVWFDHQELVRALDFAKGGGLERARERDARREREERERHRELAGTLPPAETGPDPWERRGPVLDLPDVAHALTALLRKVLG